MIVSRRMAEAAVADLGGLDLDTLTEPVLSKVYRDLAKALHPDKEGGDIVRFVIVDRAKCLLMNWLAAQARAEPGDPTVSSTRCPMCNGEGRRTLQRGFHSMTMICGTCRGHGEIIPDEKMDT